MNWILIPPYVLGAAIAIALRVVSFLPPVNDADTKKRKELLDGLTTNAIVSLIAWRVMTGVAWPLYVLWMLMSGARFWWRRWRRTRLSRKNDGQSEKDGVYR